jgi:methylglutamate dehydrogenase subunit B
MRIPCPYCGERNVDEFFAMGAALPVRPAPGSGAGAWHDHVYLRDNPAGESTEYWHHHGGCRAWLFVRRDTRTHAVLTVRPAREVA